MVRRHALGIALGALLAAVLAASGLVGMTPAPWALALPSSLALGALGLLVCVLLFKSPAAPDTREGRWTIAIAGTLLVASALALAGMVGYELRSEPTQYRFLVTNTGGIYTPVKSVPDERAQTDDLLSTGDLVMVECFAEEQDWRWFRLNERNGWLREDEVMPEPHTGQGSPPRCPD